MPVRPSLLSEVSYSATLAREFTMVEPEGAMKRERAFAGFDFQKADEIVGYALAHGMKVRSIAWSGITSIRNGWQTADNYTWIRVLLARHALGCASFSPQLSTETRLPGHGEGNGLAESTDP
jgi:GH35 family endo-1,4-beta-xylanase